VLKGEAIPEAGIEETTTRIVLEAEGDRTRMTLTSGPYSEMAKNAEAGWFEAIANLERLLAPA
jgi:hypothetical protein